MGLKKLLLFLLIGVSFAFAQEGNGRIQGTVTDSITGEVLFGANVWLEGSGLGAASDMEGRFVISRITPGTYTLIARYIGYQQLQMQVEVTPGSVVSLNIGLVGETIEGETVIVTGQAMGQLGAINQQLSSNTVKNVVSSERIRELPDESAATALSRLPGLSLMDGDKVVIRGVEARLNTVLINGIQLPSTDMEDRSTNLGFISSNMLAGIEVTKVLTPDMDANAIGGVVNLRLKEAPENWHFDVMGQGGYNTLDKTSDNYQVWGSISNRFFNNNLGVFVQGNARQLNGGNDIANANYIPLGAGSSLGFGQATYGMDQMAYDDEANIIKDYGGSVILDYKLPNGSLVLQNSIAFTDNDLTRYRDFLDLSQARRQISIKRDVHSKKLIANALQGEYSFGDLNIDFTLSHAYSNKTTDLRYGDDGDEFGFNIPRPYINIPTNAERVMMTPQDIYNLPLRDDSVLVAKVFESAYTNNEKFNQRVYTGMLNFKMPFNISDDITSVIKVGGKYNFSKRENDVERYYARITENPGERNRGAADYLRSIGQDPAQILTLNNFLDNNYDRGDYLDGMHQMYYLDTDKIDQYMRLAPPFWTYRLSDSREDDFSGEETLLSGYLMGEFNIGPQLSVIAGLRYEQFDMNYKANFVYETMAIDGLAIIPDTLNKIDRNYGNWFPNLQVRYKFTDWFDMRLAYTKTISRPDYVMLLPKIFQQSKGDGEAGNPNLNPAISTNFDAY